MDREIYCKEAFEKYLKSQYGMEDPVWYRVSRGQDPPDFYLTLGERKFAVEVTSTKVERLPSVGQTTVLEERYEKSHIELVKEVERRALEDGILTGSYHVWFNRPLTGENFKKVGKKVIKDLLDYIGNSRALDSLIRKKIYYGNDPVGYIWKRTNQGYKVAVSFADGAWTGSPDFISVVQTVLGRSLQEKKQKIEKKGVQLPVILIILNRIVFADRSIFEHCIEEIGARDYYHSIFIVEDGGSGFFIHTRDNEWKK